MKRFDAVVIGAGAGGGSAANFLAEAGFQVALVERAEFPRRKVCGEFVSATTFPILDQLGVGEALRLGGGPPVSRVGVYGSRATVTAPMPSAPNSAALGRTLRRDLLDTLLVEAARERGVEVYQPWKAVGLESENGEHRLTIASGNQTETLAAPIVVAAHGSWEVGTLPTQPQKRNRPDDLLAFKAYYHGATFDPDLITLIGIPGGYGGMVHRDAEAVGLSICLRRDLVSRAREDFPSATAGESVLRYAAHHSRGVAEAIGAATLDAPPIAAGPIRPGLTAGYKDGIFRVGNAAGEAHPAIAEGISIAIQSGLLLASHLARASGSLSDAVHRDQVGSEYDRAWRAQFGRRLLASELYARACMSPVADRLLAPILTRVPGLLTWAAALSGKTRPLDAPLPFTRRGIPVTFQ